MSELEKKLIAGICSRSAVETEALAARIGAILPVDTVLALHGDLGAGKEGEVETKIFPLQVG